jgi:hypothetical protein
MGIISALYGAVQALTITLNSLANGVARECTAVDNTTSQFLDAQVTIIVKLPVAGTPSGNMRVRVYAYGSVDGTNFTDTAAGVDGNVTLLDPTNLVWLGDINTPSGNRTYKGVFGSLAGAFSGILPAKWGIVVLNDTGLAFDSTGCEAKFRGMQAATA